MNEQEKLKMTDEETVRKNFDWLFAERKRLESENEKLNQWVHDCQSGMYINCVYCGHRYGPDDGNHLLTMQDALKEHIETCPKHPMSLLKRQNLEIEKILRHHKEVFGKIVKALKTTSYYKTPSIYADGYIVETVVLLEQLSKEPI